MPSCFGSFGSSSRRSRKDNDYSYSYNNAYKPFGDRFVQRTHPLPVEYGYGWTLTEEIAAQNLQRVYPDGNINDRDYGYNGVVGRTQKSQAAQGAKTDEDAMLAAQKWNAYDKRCAYEESRNAYYAGSDAAKVHHVQETNSDPRILTLGAKKTARVVQQRPGIGVTSHTLVAEVYKPQRGREAGIDYSGSVLKVYEQGCAPSTSSKSSSKLEPVRIQDTATKSSFGSYSQLQLYRRQQYPQYTTTESKKQYDKRMKKMGLHRR
ncbi:hypothetical protein CPC08DRAFT_728057 [Agrocybe pediades]|nr:hypothetical protein CPC08DRAFT_728057 [Agrocybe pediades]